MSSLHAGRPFAAHRPEIALTCNLEIVITKGILPKSAVSRRSTSLRGRASCAIGQDMWPALANSGRPRSKQCSSRPARIPHLSELYKLSIEMGSRSWTGRATARRQPGRLHTVIDAEEKPSCQGEPISGIYRRRFECDLDLRDCESRRRPPRPDEGGRPETCRDHPLLSHGFPGAQSECPGGD